MKRLFLLLFLSGPLLATGCIPKADCCIPKADCCIPSADCLVKSLASDSAGQLLIGQLDSTLNIELMLFDVLI